jgi:subtilisin family serine protease
MSDLVNHMLNLKIPVMLMPISNDSYYKTESYCTMGNYHVLENEQLEYEKQPIEHEKYIIVYKNDVDVDLKTGKLNNMSGFHAKHKINNAFKGCTASLNKGLLSKLLDDPEILYLEKDTIFHNTCYSKEEFVEDETTKQLAFWHQNMTNTQPQATDDFSQIHCYIVDTGINPNHQEFTSGQVVLAYNAINKSKNAADDHGHGTAVASMVGGNTVGVAKKTVFHAIT